MKQIGGSMLKSTGIIAGVLLLATSTSWAETPEQRQACTDDAFRVCQQAIPDQDRVFRCLVQNSAVISPLCRSALAPYLAAERPASQAAPKRKSNATTFKNGKGPLSLNPQ